METVKGFKDFTGEEAVKRNEIQKLLVETFERYGFEPAETPVVEYEKFVKGDNSEDEAVSDIFRLKDKGKRNLALRYEFTFQLKRISKNKKLPYRRFQIGPVFRDEPVSTNRLRQFIQCDADLIGSSIKDEAEILAMASGILKNLGIDFTILVNNRELLNEILEYNGIKEKNKEKVLRELDKSGKIPAQELINNLKKINAENIFENIKEGEKYFSKFPRYKDITSLREYCKSYGIKVEFSPTIIRGLSYYNGTVFEIKSTEMKETIIAGGAYKIGNNQSFGISFGLDRLASLVKKDFEKEKYLVVSLNQDKESIKIANSLREKGNNVIIFYGKPSKSLEYANSYKINKVIFVGDKEVKSKKFKIKNMDTGKEIPLK